MTKYKIVGIIDLFLGIPQLLISIIFPLTVFPKLSSLYSDFNVNSQPNLMGGYLVVVIILLIAITNLFLGVKGLTSTKDKDKYFKFGIISAIVTFFLTGTLVAILNISVIFPIYNLTSQF